MLLQRWRHMIMEAIRLQKVLEKDGEISISGLPYRKGQQLELILLAKPTPSIIRPNLTARQLINSELIGIWKERKEIIDSTTYARRIRNEAQNRME